MKIVLRIVRIHALLAIVLWLLAHVESMFQCGPCGAISYSTALAFFILILPGFKTVGQLIPYAINEPSFISFIREFASLIATEVMLFALVFILLKAVTHVRNLAKA